MLQPLFSHDFTGTIWRLEIDEISDTMVVEIRNQQDKQVSFASIDLNTGKFYFDDFTTDERWLTGIEAVYDGVALLHYYKHETGPEHKGIIAINAATGQELWSNYSFAFDQLSINGPVVYNTNMQPKKLVLADIKTGRLARAYEFTDKPLPNSIVIPVLMTAEQRLSTTLPEEPFGNIVHYLDHNTYRIVSLHTFKNAALQQHLFVTQGETIVYHNLLNSGIQKLQPEAFVLHKNALIFIRDRTELRVLNL